MIQDIKSHILLSSIIYEDVRLTKKGKEFLGCCPFHKEKTPSFFVNDEKGLYYCFGCGAKGDVFTYLEVKRGCNFENALKLLSEKTGIKLTEQKYIKTEVQKNLLDVYEKTCLFFESYFYKIETYLKQREIDIKQAKLFRIGFCPAGVELYDHLSFYFNQNTLEKSGLFIKKGAIFCPFFHNRLIFPIFNASGKIIAFGGRTLDDKINPKYINSPETDIFSKQNTLYGLSQTNKKEPFIIVEGYFDVIRLYQMGYNGVSPLGTALSIQHLEQIWKYDPSPLVCFDGDKAGQNATTRLINLVLPYIEPSKILRFIKMPENEDPDSILKTQPELFESLKEHATLFAQKIWEQITALYQINIPEEAAKARDYIIKTTKVIRSYNLAQEYRKYLFNKLRKLPKLYKEEKVLPIIDKNLCIYEKMLLALIINHPILLEEVEENLGRIRFKDNNTEIMREKILIAYNTSSDLSEFSMQIEEAFFQRAIQDVEKAREIWWQIWRCLFEKKPDKHLNISQWENLRELKSILVL